MAGCLSWRRIFAAALLWPSLPYFSRRVSQVSMSFAFGVWSSFESVSS